VIVRNPQFRIFLRRLDRQYRPAQVLLFGSRARGQARLDSDIDLLIVSDAFEGVPWIERVVRVCRLGDGDIALEPFCYTTREFAVRSKQITIVREAARTGVPIAISGGRRPTP
jgi:hypothetical protein